MLVYLSFHSFPSSIKRSGVIATWAGGHHHVRFPNNAYSLYILTNDTSWCSIFRWIPTCLLLCLLIKIMSAGLEILHIIRRSYLIDSFGHWLICIVCEWKGYANSSQKVRNSRIKFSTKAKQWQLLWLMFHCNYSVITRLLRRDVWYEIYSFFCFLHRRLLLQLFLRSL
jgi:hypothetical protein